MTLVVVGVSHKTAGVELRGKLAVPADRLRADLSRLLANDEVSEAVVLSTCNRTEAYAVVLAAPKGVRAISRPSVATRAWMRMGCGSSTGHSS